MTWEQLSFLGPRKRNPSEVHSPSEYVFSFSGLLTSSHFRVKSPKSVTAPNLGRQPAGSWLGAGGRGTCQCEGCDGTACHLQGSCLHLGRDPELRLRSPVLPSGDHTCATTAATHPRPENMNGYLGISALHHSFHKLKQTQMGGRYSSNGKAHA